MTIVNTINNLGAAAHVDAEAEFRLLRLAKNIVNAKKATTNLSFAVKGSYGSSVLNVGDKGRIELLDSVKLGPTVQNAWADVAFEMEKVMNWFNSALREDYSQAFVDSLSDKENLFENLQNNTLTRGYMKWAFDEMKEICSKYDYPVDGIIACYKRVRDYAEICQDAIAKFNKYLEQLYKKPNFSLYDYIFEHLALKAEKPKLFELDEAYFAAMCSFDIYYEALEQTTRHAHTLIPETHDDTLEHFDLKFTVPMTLGLEHQKNRKIRRK